MIFVFGSNLSGVHGGGAARNAVDEYGAIWGQGEGLQGRSYALPTKDENIETLPLHVIKWHVDMFMRFARANSEMMFQVTRVGCGLAGYTDQDIAPMFRGAPENCCMPTEWEPFFKVVEEVRTYWRYETKKPEERWIALPIGEKLEQEL